MLFNFIKIGDRIEIKLAGREHARSYISQVEEIMDDGTLLIHVPISYGQLVKLPVTGRYQMLFFTDKGKITFLTVINEYIKEDLLNFMSVTVLDEGERVQLREFFRYNCLLPFKFAPIDVNAPESEIGREALTDGIIKDISGGGLRFVTNLDMEMDQRIKCILLIGEECIISIGVIVRRQFFPKSNYKYQFNIKFAGMPGFEQEKIVKFIFEEQKKELSRTKVADFAGY